ncbi:hypothetical protein LXM50_14515 [Microbacterium sp. Au-Mic1]|uniref:hypothetical protein n=1 Tax=Microbacterium sp. Au-Mic1 TaxID=2906457 RepID=UPI001E548063|nr:hypothetical protein [Microbacterium sp. Au-Mic1]MCE4027190.1 hypothetical protein [Microbacterium sp. Au-Mic1]
MSTIDTTPLVLDLLRAAATAHGAYEAQDLGGIYDEQWPEWYAAHMVRQLEERGLRIAPAEALTDAPRGGERDGAS